MDDLLGTELGGLEVFRPAWWSRWFFGTFAGERGVRLRFSEVLDEGARRLLLVAAIHLGRSI